MWYVFLLLYLTFKTFLTEFQCFIVSYFVNFPLKILLSISGSSHNRYFKNKTKCHTPCLHTSCYAIFTWPWLHFHPLFYFQVVFAIKFWKYIADVVFIIHTVFCQIFYIFPEKQLLLCYLFPSLLSSFSSSPVSLLSKII